MYRIAAPFMRNPEKLAGRFYESFQIKGPY